MSRVFVPLGQDEKEALLKLAEIEFRQPVDQARFIIRQELERRGLLQSVETAEDPKQSEGESHVTA